VKKNRVELPIAPAEAQDDSALPDETGATSLATADNSNPTAPAKAKKRKEHGRNSANDYTGATIEKITHPTYLPSDLCPNDCGGKLYLTKAGQFIRVQGGSLIAATKYEVEKLRCNLCNEIFFPQCLYKEKYDAKAIAVIAISRYQMGTPMYRLARFQEIMGVPLPEGTQWGLILKAFSVATIIFKALVKAAAQVDMFFIDDTWVRILDIIRHNKQQTEKKNKKGTHTSGILALQGDRKIFLYFSGTQHAGQNLTDVLAKRETDKIPIQMSDALSRNKVDNIETIECHCIEHGKRQFTDIAHYFPAQCQTIIAAIRQIYRFEQVCLDEKMSFDDRLAHHQQHSKPVLDELKGFMEAQFENKTAEPNGSLGKAINYWLKRWDTLTTFLRVPGAAIHNNLIEQGLKMAILSSKNSLFFKTLKGAEVGSTLMSVIRTAAEAGANPVEYLTALLENQDQVVKEPENWLPWVYAKTSNPHQNAA
jgi:transposase